MRLFLTSTTYKLPLADKVKVRKISHIRKLFNTFNACVKNVNFLACFGKNTYLWMSQDGRAIPHRAAEATYIFNILLTL